MTNVITLPARPAAEPSDHDLLMRALEELASLRAELARKPLPLPHGWPTVKALAHAARISQASIYRAISAGDVFAVRIGNVSVCHPDDAEKLKNGFSHEARAS
jgi:hypothetical protein